MFLKFRDSHSSPYCYEEQISTVQISELTLFLFFGVFSSFSVSIMGFGRSWSAGPKLGIWDWVTKPLTKGLLPLSCAPASLLLFPTLTFAARGGCPENGSAFDRLSYLLTSAKAWSQRTCPPFPSIWWRNYNNRGEDWPCGQRALLRFWNCWDLMSVATVCHCYRCFLLKKQSTTEAEKDTDWC